MVLLFTCTKENFCLNPTIPRKPYCPAKGVLLRESPTVPRKGYAPAKASGKEKSHPAISRVRTIFCCLWVNVGPFIPFYAQKLENT